MLGSRIDSTLDRILWEFLSVNDLRLTVRQAAELTGQDRVLCETVLEAMTRSGLLERAEGGPYILRPGRLVDLGTTSEA